MSRNLVDSLVETRNEDRIKDGRVQQSIMATGSALLGEV